MGNRSIGKRTGTVVLVAVSVMLAAGDALAASAPDVCNASKLDVAGRYGRCRLKAEAKGVRKGRVPDFTVCDATFARAWTRAESRAGVGVCPSEGDAAAVSAFVAQHTDDLAIGLGGGSLPDRAAELAACEADLDVAAACGNGVVDVGEDCDFGDLGGDTCEAFGFGGGELACGAGCVYDTTDCETATLRVFLTSTTHAGNFGGAADGDDICRNRAAAAGLGGDWKVWLSTAGEHARDRISDAEYRLVDGTTVIATSLADLTDGGIQNRINMTEFGTRISSGENVWTGTLADGTGSVLRCANWSNAGSEGMAGFVLSSGGDWTNAIDIMPCNVQLHLYCFEN